MRFLKIIGLMFFSSLAVAASEVSSPPYTLYVEPEATVAPLIQANNQSKGEVDVVMYLFSEHRIAKALANAAHRGVTIKVLLDKAPYKSTRSITHLLNTFDRVGINYHLVPDKNSPLNFYHEKMMLIDHQQAWIMTSNFTYSSFANENIERNFILQDQKPADVSEVQQLFNADWQGKEPQVSSQTNLVVSPINSREQLTTLVLSAKTSLNIYAEQIIDYDFIGALKEAADRGVKVSVIIDQKLKPKAEAYFRRHHIQFHYPNSNFKNHAKVIIVDDQYFYLGSTNFTKNSFEGNRELGIILNNAELAKALSEQFQADWQK